MTPPVSIHDIYVLESCKGESVKDKLDRQATLEINLTKMAIMGIDGCNQFGGKISHHNASKGELHFSEIMATEMYCDEMSNQVGNVLHNVKKYTRKDMILQLLNEQNEVLLTYKKVD